MLKVKVFGPFDNIHHLVRPVNYFIIFGNHIHHAQHHFTVPHGIKGEAGQRPLSSHPSERDIEREAFADLNRVSAIDLFIRFDLAFSSEHDGTHCPWIPTDQALIKSFCLVFGL